MRSSLKKFKGSFIIILILLLVIIVIVLATKFQQTEVSKCPVDIDRKYTCKIENESCLKCHAKSVCEYKDPDDTTKTIRKKMPVKNIIDTNKYYKSNHWDFKCIDCHSDEYKKAPHDSTLKEGTINTCLDCHLDDEKFAKYHFDKIDAEYRKSTHFKLDTLGFSCWSCHDEHYNVVNERNCDEKILDIVAYSNAMCLNCHNDTNVYNKFGKPAVNLIEKHNWLPYMSNHFENVRCIDCHSSINDTILADHCVMPKEKSVRQCADCHSANSILYKTLYERRTIKNVNEYGFYNSILLKEQFVIGSNRNYYLSIISIAITCFIFFIILMHLTARFVINKKKKK